MFFAPVGTLWRLFRPGPPEFTEELRMRQETDGVLLESYLIYEPEHQVQLIEEMCVHQNIDCISAGAISFYMNQTISCSRQRNCHYAHAS